MYRHSDGLPEYEFSTPDDVSDWHVKVSEHCGFPRWDDPTDRAFDEAARAYEGPLGEAMAGLGIEPA